MIQSQTKILGVHEYEPLPKFLLIDDDPVYSEIFEETAENLGCSVRILNDCKYLEYFSYEYFDMIFLDYQLGDSNGLQLAPSISEIFEGTPIVLISSNTNITEMQMTAPEITEFLPKTLTPDEIVDMGLIILEKLKVKH